MSMVGVRQLNALFVLGWALVKHLLARPFQRRSPATWIERLERESLGVVPPQAWELFEPSSRCIGCGACDAVGRPGEPVSQWLLGIAREPADALVVGPEIDRLAALAPEVARICPARVDVQSLVLLARENARMLERR